MFINQNVFYLFSILPWSKQLVNGILFVAAESLFQIHFVLIPCGNNILKNESTPKSQKPLNPLGVKGKKVENQ